MDEETGGKISHTCALVDRVTEACAAQAISPLPFWSRLSTTTPSRYRPRRLPLRFSFLLPPRVRVELPCYLGQTGPRVCSMTTMMMILRLQFFCISTRALLRDLFLDKGFLFQELFGFWWEEDMFFVKFRKEDFIWYKKDNVDN